MHKFFIYHCHILVFFGNLGIHLDVSTSVLFFWTNMSKWKSWIEWMGWTPVVQISQFLVGTLKALNSVSAFKYNFFNAVFHNTYMTILRFSAWKLIEALFFHLYIWENIFVHCFWGTLIATIWWGAIAHKCDDTVLSPQPQHRSDI